MQNISKLLKKVWPLLFLLLLTLIFFSPVIFQNKTFYAFDTLWQHLPWSSYVSNFRPNNTLITDPVNLEFPFHQFIKNCLQQKIWPFWNNNNFCGMPIGAGGISSYMNPAVLISYLLFPATIAHDLILWLHLFGTGIFMFLYLRIINLNTYASIIGAIAWMFNGYIMVWFEFSLSIILACSFSASLCFFEYWLKNRSLLHCLLFICSIGFAISSGFPHIIIFQFIFLGIYICYRLTFSLLKTTDFQRFKKKEFLHISIVIFTIIGISATFLVSHLSTLEDSQRPKIPFQDLYKQTGEVPFKYLITLIFPDFFGSPASNICFTPKTASTQSYNNYNELCIYAGILPLFLAFTSLLYLFKKKFVVFYFLTALISLTMAMGSILYYPLAKFIPGLNLSTPTRILYIFGFSISVLAAIGADIISSSIQKKSRVIGMWLIISAIAFGITGWIHTISGIKWALKNTVLENIPEINGLRELFSISSLAISIPLGIITISILLLIAIINYSDNEKLKKDFFLFMSLIFLAYDLISFSLTYNTVSPRSMAFPSNNAIDFFKKDTSQFRIISFGNFMHNSFAPFGIQDVGGYSPFYPSRYGEYLYLTQHGIPSDNISISRWTYFNKFGSPLFDLINTKYVLLPSKFNIKSSSKLKLVYDNEIKIFENLDCFQRVFFVSSYDQCNSKKDAYETIFKFSKSDFQKTVILETKPPEYLNEKNNDTSNSSPNINIISYKSGEIEIKASTSQNGFIVISENYHPDWVAKIDGEKNSLLRANYAMMAVPLKAGIHRIELSFEPFVIKIAMVVSILSWVILLGTIIIVTIIKYYFGRKTSNDQYS